MAEEKSQGEDPPSLAKAEAKSDRPSNLCCYSQRVCNLEKLKGFDFCHKHILEDKASPFKPCDFVAKSNGRRCPNPAPKLPDRGKSFCIIHTRKAELRRAVEERRKRRHHEGDVGESYDGDREKRRRTSSSNSQKSDKLDNHSSDDEGAASGDDYLKVDSAWHGDIDSDAESVDSEEEDPLKHAGVWTVEEATKMCRDKMIRLRSLYIAQFKRLQHVLKERKRKYCQAIQAEEQEETGECHMMPTQLLGHKRLHERPGTEALLYKQAKEKKQGTNMRQQAVSTLRCTYSPGGNRCTEKVLPLTKHCIKHITHDPNQMLFQQCTFQPKGDSPCDRNVAKVFKHTTCKLHMELPSTMNRPDVNKDLQDAKQRSKLRKERALQLKEKPEIPEALQQKSSALVPPATAGQPEAEETGAVSSEPHQETISVASGSLSAGSDKMHVDTSDNTRKTVTDGAATTASSACLSVASPSDPSESISPGLAAASLVAVCSSPQLPLQGTPLSSISDIKLSSESHTKAVPAIKSDDQQQSKRDSSSEGIQIQSDAEPKPPGDEIEGSLKRARESTAADGNDRKGVTLRPVEMVKTDSATDVQSHNSDSAAEQFKQKKDNAEVNVAASSTSTSPTVFQGSSQAVALQGISNTSSKIISPTTKSDTQNFSEGAVQIALKKSSQGPVTSGESSADPAKNSSKTAFNASGASKVSSPATSKVALPNVQGESPQVPSKGTLQSSTRGALQEAPKNTPLSASPASPAVPKQAIQVSSVGHPSQLTIASPPVSQPSKASTTKGNVASDIPRPTPVKPFQHLPSGMTSSSSKQFSAIASVTGKETIRETKTDTVKSKDTADTGKL